MFFDKEKFDKIYQEVLSLAKADELEVNFYGDLSNYIRISNSQLHQNGVVKNVTLHLRAAKKDRVVTLSTNDFTEDSIRDFVSKANSLIELQSPNPYFAGLPKDTEKARIDFREDDLVPYDFLISRGHEIVDLCKKNNMDSYALLSSGKTFRYLRNSHGLEKFAFTNDVLCDIVVLGPDNSRGFAFNCARDAANIDFTNITMEAIEKCKLSRNPVDIAPGKYPVIFESYAVCDFVFYLSYLMFKGDTYEEKRSPVSGKLDQKIFSDKFSLVDEPYGLLPYPFDMEGTTKKTLPLIDKGVLKNICYNSFAAKKYNKKPTGHYWGGFLWGPYGESVPINVKMTSGSSRIEDMVQSIDKGVYVTRVHYVNIAHPMTATLTGLTREGAFWIENGKISKALKTARFTQSMMETFNNIDAVSKDAKFIMNGSFYGDRFPFGYQVPAIQVSSFNFTM